MNIRIRSFVILIVGVAVGGSLAYFLTMRYAEAQAKAMYHVGVEHHDEGKIDLSIAVLNRAVGKDSTISGPLQLLGRIYSAKGDVDLALDTYSDALKNIDVKKNRIDYYITLCSIADLNIQKGNKKEGMRIYTTVINEFPDIEQLIAAFLKNVAAKPQRSISDMQMETLYKRFILEIAEAKKQRA